MIKKVDQENTDFTREELQDILASVKELSMDDLANVFGSIQAGDEREEYTLDETVTENRNGNCR